MSVKSSLHLDGLMPGTYRLRLEHDSRGSAIVENVTVAPGAATDVKEVTLNL